MSNSTIIPSLPEQVTQEQPNTSENTRSQPFDAAAEVARARTLLVQVHAVWPMTVAHIRELIALDHEVRTTYAATRRERDAEIRRIDRTRAPVNEACAKDCGSKVCDLYGCMLDRDAVPPVRHEEVAR